MSKQEIANEIERWWWECKGPMAEDAGLIDEKCIPKWDYIADQVKVICDRENAEAIQEKDKVIANLQAIIRCQAESNLDEIAEKAVIINTEAIQQARRETAREIFFDIEGIAGENEEKVNDKQVYKYLRMGKLPFEALRAKYLPEGAKTS